MPFDLGIEKLAEGIEVSPHGSFITPASQFGVGVRHAAIVASWWQLWGVLPQLLPREPELTGAHSGPAKKRRFGREAAVPA